MYLSGNGVASHPQFKSFSYAALKFGCDSSSDWKIVYFRYRLNGVKQKGRLSNHTKTALLICKTLVRRIFQYNVSP